MATYIISKLEDAYIIMKDGQRINPAVNYTSLLHILYVILIGEEDLENANVVISQKVKTEKDARFFSYLWFALKESSRSVNEAQKEVRRSSALEEALKNFEPKMTVEAFLDHARLEGLLG